MPANSRWDLIRRLRVKYQEYRHVCKCLWRLWKESLL